jgi:hypothetical protein
MSNLSDKELDRLSREAADFYEPDHSSLSWSRLEQKLTGQMPERPPDGFRFGRIHPYAWGSAVVLVAGISFFLIKNNFYSKHSTRTNNPVSQSVPGADHLENERNTIQLDSISSSTHTTAANRTALPKEKMDLPAGGADHHTTIPGHTKSEAVLSEDKSAIRKRGKEIVPAGSAFTRADVQAENSLTVSNKETANKKSGKKGPAGPITASLAAAGSSASAAGLSSPAVKSGQTSDSKGSLEEPVNPVLIAGNTSKKSVNNAEIPGKREPFVLPAIVYSGTGPGKVQGNDSLLNQMAQSNAPVPAKSVHINRSLNIGLAFGPDYTDAGGIANNQLSNNIGITVGYYLTSKLSVNTGLFYSNKFYWSPGHGPGIQPAYQQGGNTATFAYAPHIEYVNGSCNMYEVPLTLRYDFTKTGEKTKFFVNAGLSSYFMLKQTYIYFFHSSGRPLAWKTTDDAQANYWFGVGDLSFGLETDMGKGFSFQAEPFFRIPLQQMGLENLKLNSYGIILSFRYAPVLSRSKR